jgi:hypothetical protein
MESAVNIVHLSEVVARLSLEVLEPPLGDVARVTERLHVDRVGELAPLQLDNDRVALRIEGQHVESVL